MEDRNIRNHNATSNCGKSASYDSDQRYKQDREELSVDPHSQAEILKVYMKQQRAAPPESFERLKETSEGDEHDLGPDDNLNDQFQHQDNVESSEASAY